MFKVDITLSSEWSVGSSIPVITKTCLYNFDPLKPHRYLLEATCREASNHHENMPI